MLDKVKKYINTYDMLSEGDRVVVGISGGADSVALLHVLKELRESIGIELFGAHINHGLRGSDAKADADFSKELCNKWGVPFFLKEVNVKALSENWKKSEEEVGRWIRYSFFNEVLAQIHGNLIATAHHKNDQAETILFHIIRGTGMQGLSGMKPIRDGLLIRPLLDVSRKEIDDYIQEQGLAYRVDSTNANFTYTRNRIRNELIPTIIADFNPSIVDGLARMGNIIQEEDGFITQYCNDLYKECSVQTDEYVDLHIDKLNTYHSAIRKRLIRLALSAVKKDLEGIGYYHIEDIVALSTQSHVGAILTLPGGIRVKKGYEYLRFIKTREKKVIAPFDVPLDIPGVVYIESLQLMITTEQLTQKSDLIFATECIYIDRNVVRGDLRIRQRRNGDRFKPLGVNGTKKLKDYFIDKKIPREERDSIPLLVDEDNIIWVVRYQLSEDYKITPLTKDILKLKVEYTTKYGGKLC